MELVTIEWNAERTEGTIKGTNEKVKEIDGFSGYLISDHGRFLSTKRTKGNQAAFRSLNQTTHTQTKALPYYRVNIGGMRTRMIHRLVAEHFVENPSGFQNVRHKDGNIHNNHYTNLVWSATCSNRGRGTAKTHKILIGKEVREINNLRKFCRENDLSYQNFCKKKSKTREFQYLGRE